MKDMKRIKNKKFLIEIDELQGGLKCIQLCNDEHKMNFIKQGHSMFVPIEDCGDLAYHGAYKLRFVGQEQTEKGARTIYENKYLQIEQEITFNAKGNLEVALRFINITDAEEYFPDCAYAITMPVNDCYPDGETCIRERAHAHIWCGENTSYINCLRMGKNENNLGIVITEGGISKYSQGEVTNNDRGVFLLHPTLKRLRPRGVYTLRFEVFTHKGEEDFESLLQGYTSHLHITAPHYTVLKNEGIVFETNRACTVYLDGEKLAENTCEVRYTPQRLGEHRFELFYSSDKKTHASFFVCEELNAVIRKRCEFIIEKQQCREKDNALYGAYLCYNNEREEQFFDSLWHDKNANRERLGMGILVCNYARKYQDELAIQSVELYEKFLRNNVVDITTGEVFDSEGKKNHSGVRLYNCGWVARFYVDYYKLTQNIGYLEIGYKILHWYYQNGGMKFYANSPFGYCVYALKHSGKKEWYDEISRALIMHAERLIENGTKYPKHEVNYEQTIVSPAVSILLDAYFLTEDKKYLENAIEHFTILRRFEGNQPDYRLNRIAIRFWDDFWFGESKCYGDTFPHYWSALSGVEYLRLGRLLHNQKWIEKGENCIRNNLNLFGVDGSASCAYVYPYTVNGVKGEFYDKLANDQDFCLVNTLDELL